MRVIFSIAATTIGEAIRRRVLLVILLVGTLLLAIAPGLQVLSARQERTVLKSFMFGTMQLTSAAIAIILTVYLIPNEIDRRTIYTILCKPVRRWQFLVGKYVGAIGALGMMMALMTFISVILFYVMQRDAPVSELAGIGQVAVMYYVQMCILAAVSITLSTFVAPLVNFFLSGGLYLVGTLFTSVFETFEQNSKTPGLVKTIAHLVGSLLPNFSRFNIQNSAINSVQTIGSETRYYVESGVYGVMYIIATIIVGMLIFEKREV
ncbi:MAG: ABC transporter permease [Armatimonadetes bacterium]|nr:ABC transporter permease [Armatimonadota bacterium]